MRNLGTYVHPIPDGCCVRDNYSKRCVVPDLSIFRVGSEALNNALSQVDKPHGNSALLLVNFRVEDWATLLGK